MEAFHVGFQYVPPESFSYLMSHLCCMATTFPTDDMHGIELEGQL